MGGKQLKGDRDGDHRELATPTGCRSRSSTTGWRSAMRWFFLASSGPRIRHCGLHWRLSLARQEMIRQRDVAVQHFFATLTGVAPETIRVLGEELQEVRVSPEAAYPARPSSVDVSALEIGNIEAERQGVETGIRRAPGDFRSLQDFGSLL
jgi:hypothetical protein